MYALKNHAYCLHACPALMKEASQSCWCSFTPAVCTFTCVVYCAVLLRCVALLSTKQVFTHVAEYLGRDCLDLLVCVDVAATAAAPTTASIPSAAGGAGGGGGGGGLGASSLQQQGPALQLLLAGAAPGASSAGSSANSAAASGSGGGGGACCYLINDVNLLTVLDTVRLLMDYSS